jgi:hypothetical protein
MFKFLAWIIFLYIVFTIVRSLLKPIGGSRIHRQNSTKQNPFNPERFKNGETFISGRYEKTKGTIDDDSGEYIDYKEVK